MACGATNITNTTRHMMVSKLQKNEPEAQRTRTLCLAGVRSAFMMRENMCTSPNQTAFIKRPVRLFW